MEPERLQASVIEHFAELDDPRRFNGRHELLDTLVIAICAAVASADGWEHVELFTETNEEWLRGFWELPHGPPTRFTFSRVLTALDAEQFQGCYWGKRRWTTSPTKSQPFLSSWTCWRLRAAWDKDYLLKVLTG